MRNYVIINGVNSLTIQGLAINNLPPITKPMIRTQREEIDGRDGDIVTELGYSAYDKQMEIGLYGNFDIDAIIKYFTGEGTIVFSNEADKYYNFKILDQIDYEKLLKFKTAVVTFHCQPFKYLLEEEPEEAEITTITGTGESITLENVEEAPMKIVYKGNTYQNGEPTPDTPIPVQVVSGDNTIKVEGKNLLDKATCDNNKLLSWTTGVTANETNSIASDYIRVNPTETYSFTYWSQIMFYDKNKEYLGCLQNNKTTIAKATGTTIKTLTIPRYDDIYYMRLGIRSNAENDNVNMITANIMVNRGLTLLPYEPYQSQTYPITLPEGMFLGWIGDYQDYIYKDNGKWYKYGAIGKVVLNGSENWSGNASSGFYTEFDTLLRTNDYNQKMLCNKFIIATNHTNQTFISNTITGYGGSGYAGQNWVYLKVEGITSASDLKTWLSSNNTTVYYVLATPTYTEITDSTLLSQLEALSKAKSYDEQTNIIQVSNGLPFKLNVSVTFLTPMEINNIGNIYAKPILTIEGTGNIGVVLNGIQILEIDLTNNGKITIDVPKLEAYDPDDDTLLNRLVTGDYMKLLINEGDNKITFTGEVSGATLTNYIRWI